MFRWYANSRVCLVHLADVDAPEIPIEASPMDMIRGTAGPATLSDELRRQFRESRWFTRGWTLQELLAPQHVLFLSKDWKLLGNVPWLVGDIATATGIPERFLMKELKLSISSIAQRMSWAAGRQTTRVEDMAYCLMGLFNINMPLLYGEGPKAFWRLQAEIIKESYDHSIFSWHMDDVDTETAASGLASYPILAPSPQCFRSQSRIIQAWDHTERSHYALTNSGLRITLPVLKTVTPGLMLAVLNCRSSPMSSKKRIGLLLYSTNGHRYTRLASIPTRLVSMAGVLPAARQKMYVASPDSLDMGDISSWAAFAMLWTPTATPVGNEGPPSNIAFLAFEGGPDQQVPKYLESRLSWRRLLCPWTRPGLMELCVVDNGSSAYAAILEFTDPKTSGKLCVMIGSRRREDGDTAWFTHILERRPFPNETFEEVLRWAGEGEGEMAASQQKLAQKPYVEIQFPEWDTKMHWVPTGCPMIVIRPERIFEEVARKMGRVGDADEGGKESGSLEESEVIIARQLSED
ncbi:hypothetical protein B0T10DRAFT_469618 [Thelonectria olida]|uniref:Heterokaryon incompatibility domain-containing protein n=1 Tax=Thelonectria olida TaxID=1576542 RepID=A0A9P8WKG7_9HYPO|nr:hypothetical protein B0T10DRAFT_469618 [Thelonectria olida]